MSLLKTFTVNDIPDLSNKTIIVTGGTAILPNSDCKIVLIASQVMAALEQKVVYNSPNMVHLESSWEPGAVRKQRKL